MPQRPSFPKISVFHRVDADEGIPTAESERKGGARPKPQREAGTFDHGASAETRRSRAGPEEAPPTMWDILHNHDGEPKPMHYPHFPNEDYYYNEYEDDYVESRSLSLCWENPQTPLLVCPRPIAPSFDVFSYAPSHPSAASANRPSNHPRAEFDRSALTSRSFPPDLARVGVETTIDAGVRPVPHPIAAATQAAKMETRRNSFTEDQNVNNHAPHAGPCFSRSFFHPSPLGMPEPERLAGGHLPTTIPPMQLSTPVTGDLRDTTRHSSANQPIRQNEEEKILPLSSSTPPPSELFGARHCQPQNPSSLLISSSFSFARAAVEGHFGELPSPSFLPCAGEFSAHAGGKVHLGSNGNSRLADRTMPASERAFLPSCASVKPSSVFSTSSSKWNPTMNNPTQSMEKKQMEDIMRESVLRNDPKDAKEEGEVYSSLQKSLESLCVLHSPNKLTPQKLPSGLRKAEMNSENFHVYYAFANCQGHRRKQEDYVVILPEIKVSCKKSTKNNNEEEEKMAVDNDSSAGAQPSYVCSPEQTIFAAEGKFSTNRPQSQSVIATERDFFESPSPFIEKKPPGEFSLGCFAVFDGHGGDDVSRRAAHYFAQHFQAAFQAHYQLIEDNSTAKSPSGEKIPQEKVKKTARGRMWKHYRTRLLSAALVQSLLHIDFTIYKRLCNDIAQNRQHFSGVHAGSTSCIVAFYRPSDRETPRKGKPTLMNRSTSCNAPSRANFLHQSLRLGSLPPPALGENPKEMWGPPNSRGLSSSNFRGGDEFNSPLHERTPPFPDGGFDPVEEPHPRLKCEKPLNDKANRKAKPHNNFDDDDEEEVEVERDLKRGPSTRLSIANLGDCRAVIGALSTGALLFQTCDHRVRSCPGETSRIKKTAGEFSTIASRALWTSRADSVITITKRILSLGGSRRRRRMRKRARQMRNRLPIAQK
ncbi:unnamed protein product [Phytomonas sp. Hart1]|nr:unnamed protein product [Phytomonas sp. Hart1]|eukprot:CCW71190.1 unnamed protein product [Phytomonas sp. isolate Hart1]